MDTFLWLEQRWESALHFNVSVFSLSFSSKVAVTKISWWKQKNKINFVFPLMNSLVPLLCFTLLQIQSLLYLQKCIPVTFRTFNANFLHTLPTSHTNYRDVSALPEPCDSSFIKSRNMLTNTRNDVTLIVNLSVYCSGYKSHLRKSICHGVDTYDAVKSN